MKEENRGTPKNKWSRMFRKKWFFPAMYLIIATLLLTVVVWYQSVDNAKTDTVEDSNVTDNYDPSPYEEDAEAVLEQQEDIQMPVADQEQAEDRKSTRLNSSHVAISYAVFCLKKKKHCTTEQRK